MGLEQKRYTCFFIGHRDAPERVMESLTAAVERYIVEYGVGAGAEELCPMRVSTVSRAVLGGF